MRFLDSFHRIVTTPHILAELSNLSKGIHEPHTASYLDVVAAVLRDAAENHVSKDRILPSPWLARLGITDVGVIEAATEHGHPVLTDDLPLAERLRNCRCDVINFNNLRGEVWLQG